MKMKLLAVCIASAWAVTGCGGSGSGSDSVGSAGGGGSSSDSVAASSSVNISASFPQSAQAAAIDGNAQSISILFHASDAGSIDEALEVAEFTAQCLQDQEVPEWECFPEEEPVVNEALLTAGSPSVSLSLVPGTYRVEALQFESLNPDFDTPPISATTSFVTLDEGSHSIELNLVHATWTNQTAFSLQLLNQLITDDNDEVIDLNPDEDGDQTLADLLELTDQPIIGMHIIGGPTFEEEFNSDLENPASGATAAFDEFEIDPYDDFDEIVQEVMLETMGPSLHVPMIRQQDANDPAEETVAFWFDEPTDNECNVADGELPEGGYYCVERHSGPAILLQEYTPDTGNMNVFNLGEMFAEFSIEDEMGNDELDIEGGLATVPFQFEDPEITTDGTTVTLDWGDGFERADVHTELIQTLEGEEEVTFLDFETDSGTTTFPDDGNRLDQVDGPTVTGGTTITGTIIEFMFEFSEVQVGLDVPTVPEDIVPEIDPVTSIMAAQAASAAGLTAQASATENGENCSPIEEMFSGVFVKYVWVEGEGEEAGSWEGGTWNHSYFLEDTDQDGIPDTVSGDDLNGDGVVEQFEVGVFENWTCTFDEVNQTDVCEDLDGVVDDTDDTLEIIPTGWEETGDGEYCLHDFTMTASQMEFSLEDLLSDTEVVVQSE
ncbi:hypothetical protein [Litoribacillus peritrichatus]|uniref:Uncharacterized protein n=1 Tax=Litoribacillus peritrichatus TaxID=718191 RepID=A0ABP7MPX8_9GAMM